MSQGVGLASCLPKTAWPPTWGGSQQLIVIDPNRDLTLTLQSGLALSPMTTNQTIPPNSNRTPSTNREKSDRSHVVV